MNQLKEKINSLNPFSGSEVVEIPGTKTLWLILFSYLNVLFNSAPDQMNLDELGAEINSQHEQCQKYPGLGLLYARNAGEWLLEAKTKLHPDEWQRWLNTNCKFSERTAETYMQMAKGWPGFRVATKKDVKTESTISYSPEVAAILESLSPFSNSEDTPVPMGIIEKLELINSTELSDNQLESTVISEDLEVVEFTELAADGELESTVISENLEVVESTELAADGELESTVISEDLEVVESTELAADGELESTVISEDLEIVEFTELAADNEIESTVIAEDLEVVESTELAADNELESIEILSVEGTAKAQRTQREEEEDNNRSNDQVDIVTQDLDTVESSDLSPNRESISAVAVEILEVIEPAKVSTEIKSEAPIEVEALEVLEIDDITVNIKSKSPKSSLSNSKSQNSKSIDSLDVTSSTSTQAEKPDSEVIIFFIPGNVVPKARPRVTGNGTYLPPRYKAWRNMAEVEIYTQLSGRDLTTLPIKKATILMRFVGKHRTNSDLDNLAGACLDALTMNGAGVLLDDRISCVSKLSVEYLPNAKKTGVWIEITRID